MAKIAICTIISMNYGNRLQNYALSQTLRKLGFDVETIRRYPEKNEVYNNLKRSVRSLLIKDKFTNFFLFDKNIKWSDCYVNKDGFSDDLEKKYDAFVIGSDQVWNLTFGFINENYFLPFVKKKRKISYSASFGVDSFDDDQLKQAQGLKELSDISVRENAGVAITEHITGRTPEVVVDPTMLLTKDEWSEISRKTVSASITEPYIFIYFLGDISEKRKKIFENIAQKYKMKIHTVLGDNPSITNCGPSEFVYLISHAALVLTDSFHACVFSIIFQKPFAVFDRESSDKNMNSRIITLLQLFHLEDRHILNQDKAESFDYFSCSFDGCEKVLVQERNRSEMFLKKALSDL